MCYFVFTPLNLYFLQGVEIFLYIYFGFMEDRIHFNYLFDLEDFISSVKLCAKENFHSIELHEPGKWNAHTLMIKYSFYE